VLDVGDAPRRVVAVARGVAVGLGDRGQRAVGVPGLERGALGIAAGGRPVRFVEPGDRLHAGGIDAAGAIALRVVAVALRGARALRRGGLALEAILVV